MKISFTGTRNGLTTKQAEKLLEFFDSYIVDEFTHGDCIGADAQAHQIVVKTQKDCRIRKRPCNLGNQRAFVKEGLVVEPPEPPLIRNKKIVEDGDFLLACPKEKEEQLRSGTWATVRHARKKKKFIIFFYPDGEVNFED